jgi:small GTP-binding protein
MHRSAMGILAQESQRRLARLKVCMVGDESVGKTSLIRRYVYSMYDEAYIRTVGTMVSKRDIELPEIGYQACLIVWDIMGRKDFIDLFKEAYFKHVRGVLAVFDVTRPKTLESLKEWIGGINSSVGEVPTFILANKQDIRPKDGLSDSDIERFCSTYACPWQKTSAKTGENVEQAFRDLAVHIIRAQQDAP